MPSLSFVLKGVKGNGKAFCLTEGTKICGAYTKAGGGGLNFNTGNTNKNIGADRVETSGGSLSNGLVIGITTDETKSGIESTVSSNIKYVIKY